MSVNRYYAPTGKRVYEFRNAREALTAKVVNGEEVCDKCQNETEEA